MRYAIPPMAMPLSAELLLERGHELGDRDAGLRHRVALADRDLLVLERLEVDGDAERRADLVLPPVAPPDGLRLVVRGHEVGPQRRRDLARERRELLVLRERQDRHLVRRELLGE